MSYLINLIRLLSYEPFRMERLDYLFETASDEAQSVAAEESDILYNYLEIKELARNRLRKIITGILMLAS